MASSINENIPPFGNATTAGVRANFLTAKQVGIVSYPAVGAMPSASGITMSVTRLGPL